jgi:hypothetical protein
MRRASYEVRLRADQVELLGLGLPNGLSSILEGEQAKALSNLGLELRLGGRSRNRSKEDGGEDGTDGEGEAHVGDLTRG